MREYEFNVVDTQKYIRQKLVCVKNYDLSRDHIFDLTIGKIYIESSIYPYYLQDDNGEYHFYKGEEYFITLKEYRKQKLEKLQNVQNV